MSAFFTVAWSFAVFSKWSAICVKAVSILPACSPAATRFTNIGVKRSSFSRMESASELPFSTDTRVSWIACFRSLLCVWSSSISSERTMLTDALTSVTN